MTLAPLLLGLVLLLVVGVWWAARRRRPGKTLAVVAATPAAAQAPPPSTLAEVPRLHPLMRRLYAATMHRPDLADATQPIEGLQAQVLHQADSILDCLDLQPQYMPRRPNLLPQLMRAVNDPAADGRAIAAIIAQDPALATSLLRIANSALYRAAGAPPVDTLERGVALIGTDGIRRIAATALMQPVLSLEGGMFAQLPAAIWGYALHAATAAADHAARHGRGEDALSAQLLGLLQGLGAVVVLRVLQETYARHDGAAPELAVAAALLDRHTIATARTVTAGWDLPLPMAEALMEQRPQRDGQAPATPLGIALRYGRLAAALAALARLDQLTDADALAQLAALEPDARANARLWTRLRAETPTD
ncbi:MULTISPECIES: HDOD domain-containing protein [Pseudoxanthomonas]|uniref:HD-like signal output (HDOD) protein n=1 Tax=Pseudoxanthomonas winnipegensis TaxID=2480810 RepID=A0AAW8GHM4_9GAMM|nr:MULTISPECIES: HDOD domain-containing protein [Pseudoxanthomonas]MDQ1120735.1 HD-like signal output (HDOD) protein [Pseudoxanthomonas winnipegensis]MDQ1133959.1 HD-like signal output (HDOD) protein [Pseudoxanthomonas winnipegensis]MDR6139806.1 HD-like signal output (HDOD) protein [Pseudoxanthomonas sp. SORGH_AS_0997]